MTGALQEVDDALDLIPEGGATMAVWDTDQDPQIMTWWRTGPFTAGFFQAYDGDRPGKAAVLIVDSMPLYLVAFMVDQFAISDRLSRWPERYRRRLSLSERDRQLNFLRSEAEKLQLEKGF